MSDSGRFTTLQHRADTIISDLTKLRSLRSSRSFRTAVGNEAAELDVGIRSPKGQPLTVGDRTSTAENARNNTTAQDAANIDHTLMSSFTDFGSRLPELERSTSFPAAYQAGSSGIRHEFDKISTSTAPIPPMPPHIAPINRHIGTADSYSLVAEYEVQLSKASGEIRALRARVSQLEADLEARSRQIHDSNNTYMQLMAANRALERELKDARDGERRLQERVSVLEMEAQQSAAGSRDGIWTLQTTLNDTRQQLSDATASLQERQRRLEQKEGELSEAAMSLAAAKARVKSLEDRLEAARREVEASKGLLESERAKSEDASARLVSLREKQAAAAQQVADMRQQNQGMDQELADMKLRDAEKTEEIKLLRAQLAAARATAAKLTAAASATRTAAITPKHGIAAKSRAVTDKRRHDKEAWDADSLGAPTHEPDRDSAHLGHEIATLRQQNDFLIGELAASKEIVAQLRAHLTVGVDHMFRADGEHLGELEWPPSPLPVAQRAQAPTGIASQIETQKAVGNLTLEVARLQTENEQLKRNLSSRQLQANNALQVSNSRLAEATAKNEELLGELQRTRALANGASVETASAVAAAHAQVSMLTQQLQHMKMENESMSTRLSASRQNDVNIQTALERCKAEIQRMRTLLANCDFDIECLLKALMQAKGALASKGLMLTSAALTALRDVAKRASDRRHMRTVISLPPFERSQGAKSVSFAPPPASPTPRASFESAYNDFPEGIFIPAGPYPEVHGASTFVSPISSALSANPTDIRYDDARREAPIRLSAPQADSPRSMSQFRSPRNLFESAPASPPVLASETASAHVTAPEPIYPPEVRNSADDERKSESIAQSQQAHMQPRRGPPIVLSAGPLSNSRQTNTKLSQSQRVTRGVLHADAPASGVRIGTQSRLDSGGQQSAVDAENERSARSPQQASAATFGRSGRQSVEDIAGASSYQRPAFDGQRGIPVSKLLAHISYGVPLMVAENASEPSTVASGVLKRMEAELVVDRGQASANTPQAEQSQPRPSRRRSMSPLQTAMREPPMYVNADILHDLRSSLDSHLRGLRGYAHSAVPAGNGEDSLGNITSRLNDTSRMSLTELAVQASSADARAKRIQADLSSRIARAQWDSTLLSGVGSTTLGLDLSSASLRSDAHARHNATMPTITASQDPLPFGSGSAALRRSLIR